MKSNRLLTGFLTVSLLSLSTVTGFAANSMDFPATDERGKINEIVPISAKLDPVEQPRYTSFIGTVKEITERENIKGSQYVLVENEEGIEAHFIISHDTYVLDADRIAVGTKLIGFYDANKPMIMIYPAQYSTQVVAVYNQEQNIKIDIFDNDLVSGDQMLKLNISPETQVVSQDGKPYTGELAGKKLAVIYTISTKSIPAQTNPEKIIVLSEETDSKNNESIPENELVTEENVAALQIHVNTESIKAPAAYLNKQGVVMVPLRAIGEALGFKVTWSQKDQSIMMGKGISLTVDQDNYTTMETASIQLGAAPELNGARTFVPLSFFKEVVHLGKAEILEGKILITSKK